MEPKQKAPLESPAWQQPAPGNERNENIKHPTNETIKPGGNSQSAEDDLDLDKQPYHKQEFQEQQDFSDDLDKQSF